MVKIYQPLQLFGITSGHGWELGGGEEGWVDEDFFFFFRLFFGCWVLEQLFLKADAAGSSIKNWGYHTTTGSGTGCLNNASSSYGA